MAHVEIRNHALWIKHIHGDDTLRARLDSLPPGGMATLRVGGVEGMWRKMRPYRTSGRPTPGLTPIGSAQTHWRKLYRRSRDAGGEVTEIEWVGEGANQPRPGEKGPDFAWEWPDPVESEAAWQAFLALSKAGWRSEKPYGPRDELYERDDE